VPQSGSPVMRAAILLASPKLEHAWMGGHSWYICQACA
jgi:hypothetical protein